MSSVAPTVAPVPAQASSTSGAHVHGRTVNELKALIKATRDVDVKMKFVEELMHLAAENASKN